MRISIIMLLLIILSGCSVAGTASPERSSESAMQNTSDLMSAEPESSDALSQEPTYSTMTATITRIEASSWYLTGEDGVQDAYVLNVDGFDVSDFEVGDLIEVEYLYVLETFPGQLAECQSIRLVEG